LNTINPDEFADDLFHDDMEAESVVGDIEIEQEERTIAFLRVIRGGKDESET
jgi:hypothetical protein